MSENVLKKCNVGFTDKIFRFQLLLSVERKLALSGDETLKCVGGWRTMDIDPEIASIIRQLRKQTVMPTYQKVSGSIPGTSKSHVNVSLGEMLNLNMNPLYPLVYVGKKHLSAVPIFAYECGL